MTPAIDHDQLFKQLLETFFVEFIELFAPALTEHLDLTQLTFLPQQYFTDIIDGDRKAIDILVQVPVKPHKITNPSTPSSSTSKTNPPAKPTSPNASSFTSPNSTANTASPSTPLQSSPSTNPNAQNPPSTASPYPS
jgi:hypothetical protein